MATIMEHRRYNDNDDILSQASPPPSAASRQFLGRLALQLQEISDRYDLCLSRLQDAVADADALRADNAALRRANADLAAQLAAIAAHRANAFAHEFRRLAVNDSLLAPVVEKRGAALPKSISIRSDGYLKMDEGNSPAGYGSLISASSPLMPQQHVYLSGGGSGKKEVVAEDGEDALELEVFNQGMFKTELCNKWEETGDCPYGDQCQFAHGMSELRPVIRHPRYKTEVCRIVLSGQNCPYGHRCHFRHSLTPSDLLIHP